jgi:uncharacterized protein YndB with AHSA1/START domain
MSQAHDDSPHTLRMTRIIHAPQQEVFDAWTTPASMQQWMCPEGASVALVEVDLRVGGAFRIDMRIAGADTVHTGIYRDIILPEKLVFTWNSIHTHYHASLVTVEFFARGDATELVLTQQQLPDEEAVQKHVAGWANLADHLATFLQQRGFRRADTHDV